MTRRGPLDHKIPQHREALERCLKHLKLPRSKALLKEFIAIMREDVDEADTISFGAKVTEFQKTATLEEQAEFLIVMKESRDFLQNLVDMQSRVN